MKRFVSDTASKLDTELWFKVLQSDYYQQMYTPLFDLFCATRAAHGNPQEILDAQLKAYAMLLVFQQECTQCNTEQDIIGSTTAKRLIHILKQIIDSLAWRELGFDRKVLQVLTDHHKTGYIDDTVRADLAWAQLITERYGVTVLINDLSNLLLYGDLTFIKNGEFDFQEMKYGKATSQNKRAIRQRKKLEQLRQFLKMGVRVTEEGRDFLLQTNTTAQTYHTALAESIDQAKKSKYGHYRRILSDCLVVDTVQMKAQIVSPPLPPPFETEDYVFRFSNIGILYQPIQRVAPYGIFPFDDHTCFDLITGEISIRAAFNLRSLQKHYQQFGLTLDLYPPVTENDMKEYQSATMGEKRKLLSRLNVLVKDGPYTLPCHLAHFCPIFVEFLQEETVVEADRQQINLLKASNITEGTTGFYVGYGNERRFWR